MMRTLERRKKTCRKESLLNTSGLLTEETLQDRLIKTDERENFKRRTIIVEKQLGTFGFELQTYAIHHKGRNEVELCTYVCDVHPDGPAYLSGMRAGDIILSVNGICVERASHETIVHLITVSPNALRLVLLFEDCVKKVEHNKKLVKLKRMLYDKKLAYRALQAQEKRVMLGLARYELNSMTSLASDDSGFYSSPGSSQLSSKSQSMSSISSGGFNLSQIPGNESLEQIALLDV
ncbi:general receptor for phosphoinositides 1-associated scaffold protein isoform X1 [Strongylocentrotus purpuratus]|uniref:PDZ domain-containing protein n=1 Tax=Strongylocentrotus purpuratus TaxID=7668 RepID=A0A7M7HFM9_STRPU|nr:general receptor for phosphoinositides 1-associated scaffold protein isoform X1 [Strongylocentrotus purpuratus]|eukprot:XP_011664248.1 PREDICTED: general receptor for phosphoinositides 1-associated scaffold protein isoform X1 [Strongylocentrotus purpuratus]